MYRLRLHTAAPMACPSRYISGMEYIATHSSRLRYVHLCHCTHTISTIPLTHKPFPRPRIVARAKAE